MPIDRTAPKLTLAGLKELSLAHGGHGDRSNGLCVMEAAAWLAGREHSDAPPCVCPIIRSFLINWNDNLPNDDNRNRLLKPLIRDVLGTKSTAEVERKRSFMALDWFIREHVPAWFDLTSSLKPSGDALRAAGEIVDMASAKAVTARVNAARAAARDAAWVAAGDAAGAAARAALKPTTIKLQKSAQALVRRMARITE